MNIQIEPYAQQHVAAVRSFNARLREINSAFRLPECAPEPMPARLPLKREEFLAVVDGEVRGSFTLKQQQFLINGQTTDVGNCQLPLSEGIFNSAYVNLGMTLLRHALRIQPRIFCLGMGSRENRLPKMLAAMRWTLVDIPFLFRVNHPFRFLRNIMALRTTTSRRLVMDAMAFSGAGCLGIGVLQRRAARPFPTTVEAVTDFGNWADGLWARCKANLSLSAVRTSNLLNHLYGATRFLRLRMTHKGDVVGWVVLLDTQMHNHRYFGNLRVGTIVDGMAATDAAPSVVQGAAKFLEERGVDLTISNQANEQWIRGLHRCGFLSARSNYILAMSPAMAALLQPLNTYTSRLHVNRGDGDGPLDL